MISSAHKFRPCQAPGCDRDRGASAMYCSMHHMRMKRNGRLELLPAVMVADMAPIGHNVTALLARDKMKLHHLGNRADISMPVLWKILRGESCRLETLQAIAAAFNVEAWQLIKPGEFPLPEGYNDQR
jgi:DNA-binding Xre family transcriptional regulator